MFFKFYQDVWKEESDLIKSTVLDGNQLQITKQEKTLKARQNKCVKGFEYYIIIAKILVKFVNKTYFFGQ